VLSGDLKSSTEDWLSIKITLMSKQFFLPVSFSNQLLPGTFEYTVNSVIVDLDFSIF
jgi:hypothetical protein